MVYKKENMELKRELEQIKFREKKKIIEIRKLKQKLKEYSRNVHVLNLANREVSKRIKVIHKDREEETKQRSLLMKTCLGLRKEKKRDEKRIKKLHNMLHFHKIKDKKTKEKNIDLSRKVEDLSITLKSEKKKSKHGFLDIDPGTISTLKKLEELKDKYEKFHLEISMKKDRITTLLIQKEEKTCSICFTNVKNVLLGCGHPFCTECLSQFKKSDNKCPTCRQTIQSSIKLFL